MKHFLVLLFSMLSLSATSQNSFTSFEQAKVLAVENELPIMLVFSGSDWCKPCIQLKKEILESEEFRSVEHEIIHLYLDFPYKRQNRLGKQEQAHNERLAEIYNSDGIFPKIILLDQSGNLLTEIEYNKSMKPENFIDKIQAIKID